MNNSHFRKLLNNRHFLRLWVSQMLSQFSIQIMNFYILTRVYDLTKSTVAVSLIWVAGALPSLLIGPFSGAMVDNFSRRKVLIISNLLQTLVVASMLFADKRVFTLYVVVFLYWLFDQWYFPAQQATAPAVVQPDLLPAANGLFLITQQASVLVGFGLGGLFLSTIGRFWTIVLAAINLMVAAVACYYLPKDESKSKRDAEKFWKDFKTGYRFLKQHREVLLPFSTIIGAQVLVAIASTVLPTFTYEVLGLDLYQAGVRLILPGAVGALLTTYLLPKYGARFRQKVIVQTGLLLAGLAMLVMSVMSFVPTLKAEISLFAAVALGCAITLIIVPAQTLVQRKTPRHLQGRIYGQMSFLLILSTTLPLFISAALADELGVTSLMLILGLLLLSGFFLVRTYTDKLMLGSKHK